MGREVKRENERRRVSKRERERDEDERERLNVPNIAVHGHDYHSQSHHPEILRVDIEECQEIVITITVIIITVIIAVAVITAVEFVQGHYNLTRIEQGFQPIVAQSQLDTVYLTGCVQMHVHTYKHAMHV